MTVVTYTVTTVVCDVCGDEYDCTVGKRRQVRSARSIARSEGWVARSGRDLCPRHAKEPT